MVGTFILLDEFPNFVVVEALVTPGPCLDLEGRDGSGLRSNVQTVTENAVHDLFEGFAGPARFRPELGRHIVVES
jgi:hypothetical protein